MGVRALLFCVFMFANYAIDSLEDSKTGSVQVRWIVRTVDTFRNQLLYRRILYSLTISTTSQMSYSEVDYLNHHHRNRPAVANVGC